MTDLKRLREIAEAATSGEHVYIQRADWEDGSTSWELHMGGKDTENSTEHIFVAFRTDDHHPPMRAKANAEFWLAARKAMPILLDRLTAAEQALAEIELETANEIEHVHQMASEALVEIRRPIE